MPSDEPKIIAPKSGEDLESDATKKETSEDVAGPRLLKELLVEWGLTDKDIQQILSCSSIEEILGLDIEDRVKESVLRWDRPPKLDQVIEEPIYELPSAAHLQKYLDGTLKGFLLKLDPDQHKVARKNLNGPTLVKGGPGTGKSLVALYRVRNLMQPDAQKSLFADSPPRTLFVTYTTTLIKASRQLLGPLLGDSLKHVTVNNLDKIVRRIIAQSEGSFNPADEKHKSGAIKDAIGIFRENSPQSLEGLDKMQSRVSPEYLIDEFDWIIEGRGIDDLATYLKEDRSGRGTAFNQDIRRSVWALYEKYNSILEKNNRQTWGQLRYQALKALVAGDEDFRKYDVVIVDEAQDLTPVGLRLCLAMCKEPKGFYMTADSGQSIYSRGFSWRRVDEDIKVRGRSTILKYNYRSTRQIAEAALQPLIEKGGGDPETLNTISVRDGPKPKMVACNGIDGQVKATALFIKQSADEMKMPAWAGAVLVRGNKAGEEFANLLTELGLPAALIKGSTFDFDQKVVKVMTIHSAKGLEFPFAAVVRVDSGQIPILWNISDPEEREVRLADERRLLSVGLSRAMRRLALIFDGNKPSPLIKEMSRDLWDIT
jgi:superfamily I DNA/RNA helicase